MPSAAMTIAAALFAVALPIVAAALLLRALFGGRLGVILRIGFAVPVGLGAAALVHVLGMTLTGGALPFWVDATIWMAVGLVSQWARSPNQFVEGKQTTLPGHVPFVATLAMVAAGVLAVVGFTAQQLRDPYGGSDAITIWNLHARLLHESPAGWRTFLGEHGHSSAFHADYPLLVPANVARVWSLSGGVDSPAPSCVAAAFLLGVVCLLYGGLRAMRGPTTATYCTAVLLCAVYFVRVAAQQFADVPFACYVLATMVALAWWTTGRDEANDRPLLLAGCLGGFAAIVKNEGLLFVVVCGVVWTVRLLHRLRVGDTWRALARRTSLLAAGLAPGLLIAAWFKLFVVQGSDLAPTSTAETLARISDPSRYVTILTAHGRELAALVELGGLVLVAHLFTVGWSRDGRNGIDRWTGLGVAGLLLAGYSVVYLNTPYDIDWHIGASLRRLYVHVWPLLLFVYGLSVAEPDSAPVATTETSEDRDRLSADDEHPVVRAA